MAEIENNDFVRTFARGLRVIEVMGQSTGGKNIAQVSEAACLPRTVVRRLLMTLIELGFVDTDEKSYWLTPSVLRLGMTYLYTLPFWKQSQVILEELGSQIRQSCAIAVLDGADIVYIQRFHAKRILAMSPGIGSRLPAYAVSMGRVLLASLAAGKLGEYLASAETKKLTDKTLTDKEQLRCVLESVQKNGYAWGEGEYDDAICGLAVPVRSQDGRVIAALNVSLLSGEYTEQSATTEFLSILKLTASRLRACT